MNELDTGSQVIAEMREFAEFRPAEQLFICRSLDIALERSDPYTRYARDKDDAISIRRQIMTYKDIDALRITIPRRIEGNVDLFMGRLIRLSAFDLVEGCLDSFAAYRFLYERMLGPAIRPWLPSAFCATAALPKLRPERRGYLLHSIGDMVLTAEHWSRSPCHFLPAFVESEAVRPE